MWAGSDNVLNFYSRPPKRPSLSLLLGSEFAFAEYKVRLGMQGENAFPQEFFPRPHRHFGTLRRPASLLPSISRAYLCPSRPSQRDVLHSALCFLHFLRQELSP
jgi:hypothetical protein